MFARTRWALSILAILGLASIAVAAHPHFVVGPNFSTANGALTVTGKIAGLGNQDVTIVVSATGTTTCTNRGGNVRPGRRKPSPGRFRTSGRRTARSPSR